jgi:hypothetical protein
LDAGKPGLCCSEWWKNFMPLRISAPREVSSVYLAFITLISGYGSLHSKQGRKELTQAKQHIFAGNRTDTTSKGN